MRRSIVLCGALLAIAFLTGDILAASSGIRIGRRRTTNNKDQEKKDREKKEREQQQIHDQHRTQLPPPNAIPELKTEQLDKAKKTLGLSDEQEKKIEALKDEVSKQRTDLLKEQAVAREAFDKAKEPDCAKAAQRLTAATTACRGFNPNDVFRSRLNEVLTAEQQAAYRTGKSVAGNSDKPAADKSRVTQTIEE